MKKIILSFVVATCILSCTSNTQPKSLDYLSNIEQVIQNSQNTVHKATLQPGDQISIFVAAKDQKVADIYNQNYTSSENVRATQIIPVYKIDPSGFIDFPQLGRLSTSGKTLNDFREELRDELSRYLVAPTITMKLENFKVSVLGEVTKAGDYLMPNGQGTVLNALAMAGDITIYGKRDNITVVRNVDGVVTQGKINLQDANYINSPYYNLMQGDYIIVSPNEKKEKIAKQDPNIGTYLSAAGIAISVIIGIITLTR